MSVQSGPLPRSEAWAAVGRCVGASATMLRRGQVHLPQDSVGLVLRFADGSTGRVYRETVADHTAVAPSFLAVTFRLRGVRGGLHTAFRAESILNTPLFVGFPGFVSKLWLAHDEMGRYRGLYEWDGASAAEHYARSLWRVLELVSARGSIDYRVVPGLHRNDALSDPPDAPPRRLDGPAWWRVVPAR
jgi:hypothetical protein